MTAWGTFAGVVGVVLALVLALARLSTAAVFDPESGHDGDAGPDRTADADSGASTVEADPAAGADPAVTGPDPDAVDGPDAGSAPEAVSRVDRRESIDRATGERPSTRTLLANVALTQAVFGSLVVGGAVLAAVPPAALGVDVPTVGSVATGVGLGVALWAASEAGERVADRLGVELAGSDRLRRVLSPDSVGEWALLLGVALPVVAVVEELLFRAALVGALPTGYGVSPWLAVGPAAVVFGLGHGAQGRVGIVVTGVLGAVLAGAFVLTGSLTVVVVAHYLLNALEFLVYER